jgi:hypothetical protein
MNKKMIITKKLKIKFNSANKKHFESLGYIYENKKEIEIPIEHLNIGSNYKVKVKCDICEKIKEIPYKSYLKNLNNGNYYSCSVKCSQNKTKNTNLKKYGVDVVFKNETIKNKIMNIHKQKYGVDNISKLDSIKIKKQNSLKNSDFFKYKEFYKKEKLDIISIDKDKKIYKIKCEKCDSTFDISYNLLKNRRFSKTIICTKCNPIDKNISGLELDLLNFIKSIYKHEVILNSKKFIGYELDIYLPKLKIAFEFNGLYWHSDQHKDKNYHKMKSDLCEEKGIQLIHIWEDDWIYKNDIIKSIISNKIGNTKHKIIADKCQIKEINDIKIIKKFLNENHIQEFSNSKIKLGLFYKNELVSLMIFNRNNDIWNLNRFCNKLNINIIGSEYKLLKYFITHYLQNNETIISNIDRSYSNCDLYENLGFLIKNKTNPNSSFIVNKKRISKSNYKKMTEHKNMFSQDIYKIYDSGLIKYILDVERYI